MQAGVSNMDSQGILDSVIFLLVSYKTPVSQSDAFRTLAASAHGNGLVADFHIYDNSPETVLDVPLAGPGWRISYVHDPGNGGVSTAYNHGAACAKSKGKDWLLLLDQDTCFPENAIPAYISELRTVRPDIAVIVPALRSVESGTLISPFGHVVGCRYELRDIPAGLYSLKRTLLCNSGSLVRRAAFEEVGGYDCRLFDFSDHDFFIRLGRLYPDYVVADIRCSHHLSSASNIGQQVIARFKMVADAATVFKTKHGLAWRFGAAFSVFARAAKLCALTRSLEPLLIALRY